MTKTLLYGALKLLYSNHYTFGFRQSKWFVYQVLKLQCNLFSYRLYECIDKGLPWSIVKLGCSYQILSV
jgi:hypothetical protein